MKLEIISRHPENRTRATPLLFVHGAFMGAWVWVETVLPYMAQHGYEAHAVAFAVMVGAGDGSDSLDLDWMIMSKTSSRLSQKSAGHRSL